MKKSATTTIYNAFSQKNSSVFLAVSNRFFILKNDFTALCTQIAFLFQEKLLIIYANIRV